MEKKVAFVTGAGMGVGYGIAYEFAKAGYDIAIHHSPSSTEGARELSERVAREFGTRTLVMEGDLTRSGVMQDMIGRIEKEFDRLDVYVNNAGVTKIGPVVNVSEEDYDTVFNINFKACYFGIQGAARLMATRGIRGSIIVIMSNHINLKNGFNSLYASSKVALQKLVETACVELAPFGIRVNGIAPGFVDTHSDRMPADPSVTFDRIPMRRWVSMEEMGQMALYLCGPYAQSIDGHVIFCDGGAANAQGMSGRGIIEKRAEEARLSILADDEV